MKKASKIIIGILILMVLAVTAGFLYYVNLLKSVHIRDARITSINNITKEGFQIDGQITAYNPSRIMTVMVHDSNIDFVKKDNNALLATGTINGYFLKPDSNTDLGFSGYVRFSNMLDLAADIAGKNETIIIAKGNIIVSKTLGVSVPFSLEFDINKPLKDFAESKLNQVLGLFGFSI